MQGLVRHGHHGQRHARHQGRLGQRVQGGGLVKGRGQDNTCRDVVHLGPDRRAALRGEAGFDIPQKFISEIDIDLWKSVMDADVNGFFNLVKSSLPHLRASEGSMVFISSAGLFKYPPGDVLSVAPKATIEHLLKGIAKEEGKNGVRANSIALGVIDTGIFHRLREENNTFFDDAWHESVLNTLALKRFGYPEEVAHTAVFLASSKAGYITGHCLPVDGGYHI